MRAAIARALGFLFGTALLLLIVLDMVRPQNPWTGRIKGEALRLLWDRHSPLQCEGNAVMELRGDSLDRERGPVFEASGRCRLTLVGVRVRAPRVLVATGDARVLLDAGSLEGKESVIDASGGAVVEVRGTRLIGPVNKAGEARVEGLEADARPAPPAADGVKVDEEKPPEKAPQRGGKRKAPRRRKG